MTVSRIGVAVIGGGPAGIAAAIAASHDGASVMLIEREKNLGGKLNQSIHDGYGFIRFQEALAGPEYAYRDIAELYQTKTIILLQTTVVDIVVSEDIFQLTLSNRHGISIVESNSIVLATGCRERTMSEAGISGVRPSGVITAGMAQYCINVMGQLPAQNCIIYGSNNLALHTARSLTLSGAKVIGVYEKRNAPVGYLDYASQCLFEHDIPIHLEHRITRVFGQERLRALELAKSDLSGSPVRGSEKGLLCDSLIFSDGFVPNNDLAAMLGAEISEFTLSPKCDQNRMTTVDGVFSCGNMQCFCDLVDYTSESGEIAGRSAAGYVQHERQFIEVKAGRDFLTCSPQYIDPDMIGDETIFYFSPSSTRTNAAVRVLVSNTEVFSQKYDSLRYGDTQRIAVNLSDVSAPDCTVNIRIE